MSAIQFLCEQWKSCKEKEDDYKKYRVDIEDKILYEIEKSKLCEIPENGSKTITVGSMKLRLNRKVAWKRVDKNDDSLGVIESSLPESESVPWKIEEVCKVDHKKAIEIMDKYPEVSKAMSEAFTTKPSKVGFSITEKNRETVSLKGK